MFVGCVGVCVGTIINSLATSVPMFIGGRFVMAFFVAFATMAAPLYLVEVSPAAQRGTIAGLYNTFYYVVSASMLQCSNGSVTVLRDSQGSILATSAVYACHKYLRHQGTLDWRIPLWLQMVCPGIFALVAFFLPESPRWYVLDKFPASTDVILESVLTVNVPGSSPRTATRRPRHSLPRTMRTATRNILWSRCRWLKPWMPCVESHRKHGGTCSIFVFSSNHGRVDTGSCSTSPSPGSASSAETSKHSHHCRLWESRVSNTCFTTASSLITSPSCCKASALRTQTSSSSSTSSTPLLAGSSQRRAHDFMTRLDAARCSLAPPLA